MRERERERSLHESLGDWVSEDTEERFKPIDYRSQNLSPLEYSQKYQNRCDTAL